MGDKDAIAVGPTEIAVADVANIEADADSERLEAGTFAGDYKVTAHVGSGAMGDVYAGEHPVIGKKVAIKVIKRRLAGSGEAAERFVREARAVNQISHPNVADVFSIGRLDDGRLFLVMDFLDGESLGARLRRVGCLEPDEFEHILAQVCDALSAAHKGNVVHRDLKPDNVFLVPSEDGRDRVYVLDFGVAKMLSDVATETARGTLTGEGVWMGTPSYMAPEQWTSEGASPRSDIYSLGTMAFEMLSGGVPYKGDSVPAIMEKHFHAALPPLTTGAGVAVPEGVADAIARAMAKKPEDRFDTPLAFLEAVRAGLAGQTVGRGRHAVAAAVSEDAGGGLSRPLMWAALAGVGVVAIGAVVLFGGDRAKQTGHSRAETPDPGPAAPGLRVPILSQPKGAHISRDGKRIGITPYTLAARPAEIIRVRLQKPGYAPIERQLTAEEGARLEATLPPVTGFKGVWRLPKGALRAFERRGDRVAGFSLSSAEGKATFLRFFEFMPGDGDAVTFGARKYHVDERAPNEPSCRIALRAQYRFHPATDVLELRRERVQYDLERGRCVINKKEWGPYRKVARVAKSNDSSAVWAVSSAGAGNVKLSASKKPTPKLPVRKTKARAKRPPGRKTPPRRAQRTPKQRTKAPNKQAKSLNLNADNKAPRRAERAQSVQRKSKTPPQKVLNPAATSNPPPRTQGSAAQRGTPPRKN